MHRNLWIPSKESTGSPLLNQKVVEVFSARLDEILSNLA